jgi:hypothetical protein
MTTAVQKAPHINIDDAIQIALDLYGIKVSASGCELIGIEKRSSRLIVRQRF